MSFVDKVRETIQANLGDPGIFGILRTEHKEVAELMDRIVEIEDRSPGSAGELECKRLYQDLRKALIPHLRGEEEVLYPRLAEYAATRDVSLEATVEHRQVHTLLAELDVMQTHGAAWLAKFKVLQDGVEHHVDEEHSDMFPKARRTLGEEECKRLATTYTVARNRHRATIL